MHGSNPLPEAGEGGLRISEGRERGRAQSKNAPSPGSLRSPPSPAQGGGKALESARNNLILVGEFGRAHGLKGEVRLKSHTGDPKAIADYKPLMASDGKTFSLKNVRPAPGDAPDLLIAVVHDVTTREAAEALSRVELYVERGKLPSPDQDEFLLADLIGLIVENEGGDIIGTVVAVPNYGGGDLLEIVPVQKGPTAFLPFTKVFVPTVDLAGKRIVANPPDDLFEPAKPAPEFEDEA